MIVEVILNLLKTLLIGLINLLPSLDGLTLPAGFISWLQNIIGLSAYFLPIVDFLIMFGFWILVINFQLVWKVIQRVWDALPFT